ncbi:hypothetical protein ACN27F_24485 [Solwaraspora sp. WMMB335]|uniref:hypothetical protein n=1 Tax=Solwaraspora sp. WMMB335 TaxID=3404118 RepID=UPI003B937DF2
MTEQPGPAVTVVDCARCAGGGVTTRACTCTWYGDQLIVPDGTPPDDSRESAYRDCQICLGTGSVCWTCDGCDGLGRCRAQLVLTVANADTTAVASVNIVPGALDPARRDGRWSIDLDAVVAELAGRVGATHVYDPDVPDREVSAGAIMLPKDWHPGLPAERRHAIEAEAIAGYSRHPWRIWLGRTAAPQRPDPARHLGQLCDLAELLCLDLVVEARPDPYVDGRHSWQLRLDLPDAEVGDASSDVTLSDGASSDVPLSGGTFAGATFARCAASLDAAIVAADPTSLATGLADRGRHAPAYYLRPGRAGGAAGSPAGARIGPPKLDLDQLERRVLADCTALGTGEPTPGAQAIWRDGRWWHTSLRVVEVVEKLTERATGQTISRTVEKLARSWQPPPPTWQGPAIPYERCADCVPEHGLRRCLGCGDTYEIRHGVVVTVTDGRTWARHLNWALPADQGGRSVAVPQVGSRPGGKAIHQVPPQYRLPAHLADLPVRQEQLGPLDEYEVIADHEMWHGYVTLDHAGQDPLTAYLANIANGHPGARVLLHARVPAAPSLAEALAMAYGLGLALVVSVVDHRPSTGTPYHVQGVRWGAYYADRSADFGLRTFAHLPTIEHALARAVEYVCSDAHSAVPTDPATAIRVPQSVPSPAADEPAADASTAGEPVAGDDLVPLLSLLGAHFAGETVTVRFAASRCEVHLHEGPETTRRVATAADLPAAVTALRLHPPTD